MQKKPLPRLHPKGVGLFGSKTKAAEASVSIGRQFIIISKKKNDKILRLTILKNSCK